MYRCEWAKNELSIAYHDHEWGVPLHDDIALFEFLILEGAQAGLSWDTILKKRDNYRRAFDNFDPQIIARYDGRPKRNRWRTIKEIPSRSREADELNRDLKQRGFKFVGPTICYAFMQAVGMVNDHIVNCFRYREIK